MDSITRERGPATAGEEEREATAALARLLLDEERCCLTLGDGDGERAALPETVRGLLRGIVRALAAGQAVRVQVYPRELLTVDAAALLGVPVPTIDRLIEAGELRAHGDTDSPRIRLDDALAFKEDADARRREALAELARINQELGLYSIR